MEATQSWIANLAILNAELRKETWYNTFWAKWSGQVQKTVDDAGNPAYQPSGKPIEILSDFVHEGRDNMLIPFLNSLTGAPVFGDTQLKGTGEEMSLKWLRAYINQFRKAVMQRSGQMSEQREYLLKLFNQAKPLLVEWWSKYLNQEIFRALYEGVSKNLSASTANDGLGLYKRYHPNFYYESDGSGTISAVGTEYKTKSTSELDTAVSNVAGHTISAVMLMNLKVLCMKLMIPRIVLKNGMKFWLLLVHPDQFAHLMQDSAFLTAQRSAYTGRALDNPELTGAAAYYADFVIYEDIVGVRAWDDSNGGFFGDDDSSPIESEFNPTSITDNACALVIGNSAIGYGQAKKLHFTKEIDDHENTIEIGGAEMSGFNRADFATESSASESSGGLFRKNTTGGVASGITVKNNSSLVVMTDEH